MNASATVDVVMADGRTDHTTLDAGEDQAPEQMNGSPDRRIIVLAPTIRIGYTEARALSIKPVAVITPRSLTAAYGITADEIIEASSLTPEMRDELMPYALPSLATNH